MKPIIFSSEMIRAILEGRKTQTRRPIKPQPINLPEGAYCDPYNKNYEAFTFWTKDHKMILESEGNIKNTAYWKCPYGKIGDKLWVKETWDIFALPNEIPSLIYKASSTTIPITDINIISKYQRKDNSHKWRPSIHMPRWASRITLEITNIKIERLQNISEKDAEKEGVSFTKYFNANAKFHFKELWNNIYANTYSCSWENNPFVWVIEFQEGNGIKGKGRKHERKICV